MSVKQMLALTALTGLPVLFQAPDAQAQPSGANSFACNQYARELSGQLPAPRLAALLTDARAARCDAPLIARINEALTQARQPARSDRDPAPPQERCPSEESVRNILASNDRTRIEVLRDVTRETCPRASRQAMRWLEANSGSTAGLTPLPWRDPLRGDIASNTPYLGDRSNPLYYREYRLRLAPGDAVTLTVRSSAITPVLAIGTGRLPERFAQVAYADSTDGNTAVLNFVAPTLEEAPPADPQAPVAEVVEAPDHTDYVVVVASGTAEKFFGGYTIEVEPYTPPQARSIALNTPMPGAFEAGTAYDSWTFQGEPGQLVRISMESDAFDSYLTLGRMEGAAFRELATNDDGGEGLNSLILAPLADGGEYVVRARPLGGGSGAYTLQVSTAEPRVVPPRPAERNPNAWSIPGQLTEQSGVDGNFAYYQDFEFRTQDNHRYAVSVRSDAMQPVVELGQIQRRTGLQIVNAFNDANPFDEEGNLVRPSERLEFRANNDGRYIIRVRAAQGQLGAFQILVTELPRAEE
jgi:hypothetical protein